MPCRHRRGAEGVAGWDGLLSPSPGLLMTAGWATGQFWRIANLALTVLRTPDRAVRNHFLYRLGCSEPHQFVDYIFCQTLVTLRVNRTVTFSFYAVDCLLMYLALITTCVWYVSLVRNSVTMADARKLERIQGQFVAL